jgi:hypothetical protein
MKQLLASVTLAIAFVSGAGCGGSQKTKAAAGPTCADAGANIRRIFMSSPDSMPETGDAVQALVVERCTNDGWSAELVQCMAVGEMAQTAQCPDKMTDAQRDAFMKGVAEAAGGPAGDAPPANEFDNAGGE